MKEMNKDQIQRVIRVMFATAQEEARKERRDAPPYEPPTIHYTELPARGSKKGAEDWETYRREIGRLLGEGNEGKFVLIHAGQIIGIWDTEKEAYAIALRDYLMQPVLIKQMLTREPLIRHPLYFHQLRGEVPLDLYPE